MPRAKMPEEKPVIYFGIKQVDREACDLIMKARISCDFVGTLEKDTPFLYYRYVDYRGIKEIQRFVERWEKSTNYH